MPQISRTRVLLALPDPVALSAVNAYFKTREDCLVAVAPGNGEGLAAALRAEPPDLLLLEDNSGLEALTAVRQAHPNLPVIVLAPPNAELAFQAARLGAIEILTM